MPLIYTCFVIIEPLKDKSLASELQKVFFNNHYQYDMIAKAENLGIINISISVYGTSADNPMSHILSLNDIPPLYPSRYEINQFSIPYTESTRLNSIFMMPHIEVIK